MRRPLKPFVTEYKGPSRRQKDGVASPFGTENETPWVEMAVRKTAQPSEPKKASANTPSARRGDPSRETGRANDTARYNGAQNEDSYEAALRAADALFSAAPVHRSINETSTPVADAIFAPKPDDAAGTAAAGSGRILRVVDEEEAPEHGALEAERTPKRRGRKPGSKNKPKIVVTNEDATFALPNRHAKADWTTLFDDEDETDEDETITPSHAPFAAPRLRRSLIALAGRRPLRLGPHETRAWRKLEETPSQDPLVARSSGSMPSGERPCPRMLRV